MRFDVQVLESNEDAPEIIRQNLQRSIVVSPLFSDIRELWMDPASFQFLCAPYSILRGLPRLQYLRLACLGRCEDWDGILQDMAEALSGVHSQSATVVCPKLDDSWVVTMITGWRVAQNLLAALVEQIRAVVIRRASLGHPLKRLFLSLDAPNNESKYAVQEARRELGSLVEQFGVGSRCWGDNGDPEASWLRHWHDQVPSDCREAEATASYWPQWDHFEY